MFVNNFSHYSDLSQAGSNRGLTAYDKCLPVSPFSIRRLISHIYFLEHMPQSPKHQISSMSAQDRSERYSPIALAASPTKNPQPGSLGNLPIEIPTTIIEQALPKNIPNNSDVDVQSCSGCMSRLKITAPHPDQRPRSQLGHRYAILYINKKIYAETLRILRARTFRIKIGQGHFFCMAPATENMRRTNIARPLAAGEWGPVFPGLDLGKIRELAIDIAPTDFQGA